MRMRARLQRASPHAAKALSLFAPLISPPSTSVATPIRTASSTATAPRPPFFPLCGRHLPFQGVFSYTHTILLRSTTPFLYLPTPRFTDSGHVTRPPGGRFFPGFHTFRPSWPCNPSPFTSGRGKGPSPYSHPSCVLATDIPSVSRTAPLLSFAAPLVTRNLARTPRGPAGPFWARRTADPCPPCLQAGLC